MGDGSDYEMGLQDGLASARYIVASLRGLAEALVVVEEGGRRIVGIPNVKKFWAAYDEAQRYLL